MTLLDILDRIEEQYSLPASYRRCVAFFLTGLNALTESLPAEVASEVQNARAFWLEEKEDFGILTKGKEKTWTSITRNRDSMSGEDEAALRAALFVFEKEPPTPDLFELLDWYTKFLKNAGVSESLILEDLTEYFPLRRE